MKVFVSSTTEDLADARKKVCEQLVQLGILPVSMDWYTADGRPPRELDHDKVSGCDAFVIIVGHLYGSCPDGEEKSFTELESEAAVGSDKAVLPFLASNTFLLPPDLQEDDATRRRLKVFRKRLEDDHAPRYFDNVDRLCAEVVAALPRPTERAGRICVPKLPQPYLAHPYPIQENFTGRRTERAMLTEWVREADSRPMLSLVGMGGLGKSALTWFWLHEDLPQEKLKLSGIVWWSFYETEASFESFLSHALLYASGGTIDSTRIDSDYDRMHALWCILRESPFLIVLDGAERLLRAYLALDAAYRDDEFKKETGDNHLRCASRRAGQFLQWLASPGTKTRTLLTTRLHPKELDELAGCKRIALGGLDPDDSVAFLYRFGLRGNAAEFRTVCERYGHHPLALRLIAQSVANDPDHPGDLRLAPVLELKLTSDYGEFGQKNRDALLQRLAQRLGLSPESIRVLEVGQGSVKVTLEFPKEAAVQLFQMYLRGDPIAQGFFVQRVSFPPTVRLVGSQAVATSPNAHSSPQATHLEPPTKQDGVPLAPTNGGVRSTPPTPRNGGTPEKLQDAVFISYSRKDLSWLERLQAMMVPLVRSSAISVWWDGEIKPSQRWREEIRAALDNAKVAVLLVSPNFLASQFINEHELPYLLDAAGQRRTKLIWVLVRNCLYAYTPLIEYQAAHDISRALNSLGEAELDDALVEVCRRIAEALT